MLWFFQVGASTMQCLNQHRRDFWSPISRTSMRGCATGLRRKVLSFLGNRSRRKNHNCGQDPTISKHGAFLHQSPQQSGKGDRHASSSRHSRAGLTSWNGASSCYTQNHYRGDWPWPQWPRGKMRHKAGEGPRKVPYPKKWSSKWKNN